ncbi:MAG TPA: anthranilate phosphoribosyltransferase [Pseudohaliea sp.]|nr:anthranilate phosphoribosyltransferase [Pseudohaliea sp.]
MNLRDALAILAEGRDLDSHAMAEVMRTVMTGGATDAQIGALLLGLRAKGETIDELVAAARVMRELATPVTVPGNLDLVDLVGTGGDGANLFNVSTAATFVAAAGGARVAKHGNRSVSSTSGSSDVLETLGVPLDLSPEQIARAIAEVGVGFMFAPAHHSAMRHAIGPRRELGMRTLFNVLGPLTNPAGVRRQVLGVFDGALCEPLATALGELGSEHALVVHGEDGLDELSLAAPTQVAELKNGAVRCYTVTPEALGMERRPLAGLVVDSADASARLIKAALAGDAGSEDAAALIALNAGATLYVAGIAGSLGDGVRFAEDLLATGQAGEKLKAFVAFTQLMAGEGA